MVPAGIPAFNFLNTLKTSMTMLDVMVFHFKVKKINVPKWKALFVYLTTFLRKFR